MDKAMEINNQLLHTVLKNISNLKESGDCARFVQELSLNSECFKKEILNSTTVKPEILKMRIGI